MSALVAGLVLGTFAPVGQTVAQDCDRTLSACHGLLEAQSGAAANQARLAEIDQQIAYSTGAIAALAQVIAGFQRQIAEKQSQIDATSARLDDLDRQLRYTQAAFDRTQAQLLIRQQRLDHRVREVDKLGHLGYLELVVTSTSFSQLVDRVATIQEVISGDRRLIDQLKQGRARTQRLSEQLSRDQVRHQSLLQLQQQQLAQLAQQQQAQREAYAAQMALEAQQEAWRQQLGTRQSAIRDRIQTLQADYQRQLNAMVMQEQTGGISGGTFSIDTNLRIVPGVEAAALDAYFRGTALAGLGPAFVGAGQQRGVNPLYLVAHAIEESAFGTSRIAREKHNLFGIAAYDSDPGAALSFPSFQACIEYEAKFVLDDYLDPQGPFYHGPTLRGMNVAYATDQRWAYNIAAIYLTLPGGLNPVVAG